MRAARLSSYTEDIQNVQVTTIDKPSVAPNTALVRVKAAGLNPVDIGVLHGHFAKLWPTPVPYTLGYDFTGVIEELGYGETTLSVGDEVFGMNWGIYQPHEGEYPVAGAIAEYIVVALNKLAKKPSAISANIAGGLGVIATTAYQNLFEIGQVSSNSRVLILGASSGVGSIAVQLAKNAGAYVATTCSSRTFDKVSTLGADKVIQYDKTKWEDDTELRDLDVIFDTVGDKNGFVRADNAKVLKSNGKYITIADFSVGFNPAGHPPYSYASFSNVRYNAGYLETVAKLVEDGKVKVWINEEFPFTQEGVIQALQVVASGKSVGKNIIRIA